MPKTSPMPKTIGEKFIDGTLAVAEKLVGVVPEVALIEAGKEVLTAGFNGAGHNTTIESTQGDMSNLSTGNGRQTSKGPRDIDISNEEVVEE